MAVILCWIIAELLMMWTRICSSSCGGHLQGRSGDLHFPGPGGNVGQVTLCEWTITVPETFRIKIHFQLFVMKTTCCSCTHDFLEIRDGSLPNSTFIGKFCAKSEPKYVFSTKNVIWLQFGSDFRTSRENRFRLSYEALCGRHYSELSGSFRSPGYPFPYKNNQDCIYTVEVPRGRIKVNFDFFNVQGRMPMCLYDFLEVKEIRYVELSSSQGEPSRRYCGNEMPPNIYSTRGSYLWFRFESDASGGASGFVANYRTVSVGEGTCGGTLKDTSGFIYSLNYPFPFPTSQDCTWKIQVAPEMHVHLYFDTLNFESNSIDCSNFFVEVYDGMSVSSFRIGQYCGEIVINKIISRTNQLSVKAVSFNAQRTGWFSLRYQSLPGSKCGLQKFTCANRECIENHLMCDGNKDCIDGSDEDECPDTEGRDILSWYRFWPVSVVGGMLIIGIWLWLAWRRVLSTRSEADEHCTQSPSPGHIEAPPHTHITAPPSYSEAVVQEDRPPPSYEEALRDQNSQNTERLAEQDSSRRTEPDGTDSTSVQTALEAEAPQGPSIVMYDMVVSSNHEGNQHSQTQRV